MRKVICTIALTVMMFSVTPVFAEEHEISTSVCREAVTLGVTPYFTLPKLPQFSRIQIKPKIDLSRVDFSKYIPRI